MTCHRAGRRAGQGKQLNPGRPSCRREKQVSRVYVDKSDDQQLLQTADVGRLEEGVQLPRARHAPLPKVQAAIR